MAELRTYKTREEIPEALREYYIEDADAKEWVPQLSGMVAKTRLDEFRENNLKLNKRVDELTAKVEKYAALGDTEKLAAALAELEELKKQRPPKKEDDFEAEVARRLKPKEEGLDKQRKDWETERDGLTSKIGGLENRLSELLLDGAVRDVAADIGLKPHAVGDAIEQVRKHYKIVDGKPIAFDENGEKLYSRVRASELKGVKEFLIEQREPKPHWFGKSGGTGDARGGNGKEEPGTGEGPRKITSAQLLDLPPGVTTADIASGKVVVVDEADSGE